MTVLAYLYLDPLLDLPFSATDQDWGEPVEHTYQDLGDRHQLNQLITDCETTFAPSSSIATAAPERSSIRLIIRHLGELGDSLKEVSDRLNQFDALNLELTILESPTTAQPFHASHASYVNQLNDLHTLHIRQRQRTLKRGHAQNRLQAKPPPGRAPYGYRRGNDRYLLDRRTAPVIKDFFDHFLLYGSLRRSVRYLGQKYNKKISVSTGQRWLSNPVYRGHLAYNTGDIIPNTHPAILSDDEAAQIDRLLRRNRQLPRRSASAERSLAGLVRCAECQSPMTITRVTQRNHKKDYLYLRPTQCPYKKLPSSQLIQQFQQPHHLPPKTTQTTQKTNSAPIPVAPTSKPLKTCAAIPYNQVLHQTIESICQTLPQVIDNTSLPNLNAVKQGIQKQIYEKQQIIDQLPHLENSGILDPSTTALRRYTVQGEISTLQTTLAQLPPVNLQATIQAVSLQQFWLDLSESERRFYFREFIHHIEIIRASPIEPYWDLRLMLLIEMEQINMEQP